MSWFTMQTTSYKYLSFKDEELKCCGRNNFNCFKVSDRHLHCKTSCKSTNNTNFEGSLTISMRLSIYISIRSAISKECRCRICNNSELFIDEGWIFNDWLCNVKNWLCSNLVEGLDFKTKPLKRVPRVWNLAVYGLESSDQELGLA